MGKRKGRHCRNKQEVLQKWQQAAGKPEPFMKSKLRKINQIKQSIQQARKKDGRQKQEGKQK